MLTRGAVELITSAKDNEDRKAPVITDIAALEKAVEDVLGMLERVSGYVERVLVSTPNGASDMI